MYFAADADLRVVKVCGSVGIEASELIQICKTATSGEPIYKGRNVIWVLDWWGKQLAVKAFGIPWGIRKWVYGSVRASKANRSYINASALIARGLNTEAHWVRRIWKPICSPQELLCLRVLAHVSDSLSAARCSS